MAYLARNAAPRENPAELLEGAKSVICVAVQYARPPESRTTAETPTGRVAQYARGADYHRVLRGKLRRFDQRLRDSLDQPFESRICVDTAPILERELAASAGIGWIGKNTLVMHPELGSYFFLGEILTTLELEPDTPATDHCGTCTRCIDACPTQALTAPYRMDATRCISYLTIEHRGEVNPALRGAVRDWVYGCDVCQEVCPFNADAPTAADPELAADRIPARLSLPMLQNLTSGDYRRLVRGTAAARASRAMWRRNADIASENAARAAQAAGMSRVQ